MTQVTFTLAQLATLFSADDSLFTVDPITGAITFTQEPMPSGDDHTGLGFFLNPRTNKLELQPVRQTFGPTVFSLAQMPNTPITAIWDPTDPMKPWTKLVTSVPAAAPYMRGGAVAYVPNGRCAIISYNQGVAASAAAVGGTVYFRWMQGTSESNPAQPNIATGAPPFINPATGKWVDNRANVGGGFGVVYVQDKAVMIPTNATDIQANVQSGHACEIMLEACATVLGMTALASPDPRSSQPLGGAGQYVRYNGMPAVYNNA